MFDFGLYFCSFCFTQLFSDRAKVPDERWATQLEQSVQPAEGGEEGGDHRLLLRQPRPRLHSQAQVRGVRFQLQEGSLLAYI